MRFIHFGCWNNGKCDIDLEENGLSKTMKKLNEFVLTNFDIEFMIIAGDNYYSKKIDKQKNMITSDFLSGVKCLPKQTLKYVLLGNHEFDQIMEDGKPTEMCHLLQTEKNIFNKLNNTIFFNNVTYRTFGKNTLIIFVSCALKKMDEL